MLPGKTDVTGVYSSDVFIHAPDILFDQLAAVFQEAAAAASLKNISMQLRSHILPPD